MNAPRTTRVSWAEAWRLVPSRFPPQGVFDRIARPEDLEALYALESLTNPRLREELGQLQLVPRERRISGPGTQPVMAAFTHLNPEGARFTTGDFGGYYCAPLLDTAVKETVYHQERIFGYTNEPAQKLQMRVLHTEFCAKLVDIRGDDYLTSPLYHATDYGPAQAFAREQKVAGADGIHYRSVRHPGHDCHVLYRPRLVSRVDHARHLEYHWSGEAITHVLEIRLYGE